jgi:hypothetical protein
MKPSSELPGVGCTSSGQSGFANAFFKKRLAASRSRVSEIEIHGLPVAVNNRPASVFARDGLRSYPIRELQGEGIMNRSCRHRTRPYANNRIESDHRSIKRRLRAMQGPRSAPTAPAVTSGDRGSTHDSQRPGFGNYPEQPVGPNLGICGTASLGIR